MHECVFNDANQQEYHITTMDMAKRLLDYGFHPPTVYFPLVVDRAFMVEPTETESKEDIDQFIEAFLSQITFDQVKNSYRVLSARSLTLE